MIAQPDLEAGRIDAEHGAGVGAVDGDDLAARQFDVGEEALVAAHQHAGHERGRKTHGAQPSRSDGGAQIVMPHKGVA